jgi:hypothetical protein
MISLISTDFPVPAEPVKKILLPRSTTASSTEFCSSLRKIERDLLLLDEL